ncbi:MAG: hypothetical protein V1836_04205 [Candidatus Aenigmatarchaeota archaeon]
MRLSDFLKKLNKLEKSYIILFALSLLAGILYGLLDKDYFKCCENVIGVPQEGTSTLKIFTGNYLLSLTELFTAGLSSLYFNFHTFSVTSSYLSSRQELFALPVVFFIGVFELAGGLFLALTGLIFAEKLLKIKSKLKPKELFLYGTALIFFGAVVEYLLLSMVV